jgi:hypothetical protein
MSCYAFYHLLCYGNEKTDIKAKTESDHSQRQKRKLCRRDGGLTPGPRHYEYEEAWDIELVWPEIAGIAAPMPKTIVKDRD